MLTELHIRGVGVITDVTLDLAPGLNVLTGETGAGKTMVVSALELLLGGRSDSSRVRAGAATALVEGRLSPPPPGAADWLDDGDDELVVSREVAAADAPGRSRARIGGRLAPVSALTACVGAAVELHGQSDSVRLATPAVQRDLLDRSGGPSLAAAAAAYRQVYERWRSAAEELRRLRDGERDRAREVDRLRYELDEIDAVAPEPGEERSLLAELRRLEHAETLLLAAAGASAALNDDGGARDGLAAAGSALRGTGGVDPALDLLADRLASLVAEAADVGLDLAAYAGGLEPDPGRLEALRDRCAALLRLTRKYGEGPAAPGELDLAAVAAYAERARAGLADLEGGDERASALAGEVGALAGDLTQAAGRLRAERQAAGDRLSEAVGGHLAELAMGNARLTVHVEPVDAGPSGADRVAFLLSANPGEPALPLAKAASGGERSRVALAVRLALADADDTGVVVFDEIDAGIGGATALAVGRKLARLARGRQVLCVTHLAQLAAYADAHFTVAKATEGSRTVAGVRRLDEAERVAELSRMLSGSPDSALATGHAAELRTAALADGAVAARA